MQHLWQQKHITDWAQMHSTLEQWKSSSIKRKDLMEKDLNSWEHNSVHSHTHPPNILLEQWKHLIWNWKNILKGRHKLAGVGNPLPVEPGARALLHRHHIPVGHRHWPSSNSEDLPVSNHEGKEDLNWLQESHATLAVGKKSSSTGYTIDGCGKAMFFALLMLEYLPWKTHAPQEWS